MSLGGRLSRKQSSYVDKISKFRDILPDFEIAEEDANLIEIDRHGFEELLKHAGLPQKVVDDADIIFDDIDVSRDNSIKLRELDNYLDSHQEVEGPPRPANWRQWLYLFMAPFGAKGTWDPRKEMSDPAQRQANRNVLVWITIWKCISTITNALSIAILFADTLPENQRRDALWHYSYMGDNHTFGLEVFCQVFFTIELLLWLISYPHGDREVSPFYRREKIWTDLATLIPFYCMLGLPVWDRHGSGRGDWPKFFFALRAPRLLRFLRIARAFIVLSGFDEMRVARIPHLRRTVTKAAMALIWYVFVVCILMIVASSALFFAELEDAEFIFDQAKWFRRADNNFYGDAGGEISLQSIPETLWWAVVTVTTVGYGDYFPVTRGGKVVAAITMLCATVIVALPITLISGVFSEIHDELGKHTKAARLCQEFTRGLARLQHKMREAKRSGAGAEMREYEEKCTKVKQALGLLQDEEDTGTPRASLRVWGQSDHDMLIMLNQKQDLVLQRLESLERLFMEGRAGATPHALNRGESRRSVDSGGARAGAAARPAPPAAVPTSPAVQPWAPASGAKDTTADDVDRAPAVTDSAAAFTVQAQGEPLQVSPTRGQFAAGAPVSVLYNDGLWHAATVLRADPDGKYSIMWADGSHSFGVSAQQMRGR